jgi:hypothetical protein
MKVILLISCSLLYTAAIGQTQEQKDSLVSQICTVLIETKNQPDSLRVQLAYEKHLYPFLARFREDQIDEIAMSIYYRLQRNCIEFKDILNRADPPKGDWESIGEKPLSILTRKECKRFLAHKNYWYLESSGDTVNLTIDNGFWTDRFKDGTYSKLRLSWTSDCEFEIEFIESNNDIRKNFSKPGDRYRYQIVDKKSGYYDMSVEITGTDRHLLFKIYYW